MMKLSQDDRLRFEEFVLRISSALTRLSENEIDIEIDNGLNLLNDFFGVERSSLLQFKKHQKQPSLVITHSTSLTEKFELLNRDLTEVLPWYVETIKSGKDLILKRAPDEIPEGVGAASRKLILKEGIKSHLSIPLRIGGDLIGALSLTSFKRYKSWSETTVQRLRIVSNIYAEALIRRQTLHLLDNRLKFETLISNLSSSFIQLSDEDIDGKIFSGLKEICLFYGIDRGHLVGIDEERRNADILYTYQRDGVPQIPQEIDTTEFPWVVETIFKKEVAIIKNINELTKNAAVDRQSFIKYSTRSHLSIPLVFEDSLMACLSLDSVKKVYDWPEELISRLRLIGEIFFSALMRYKSEKSLKAAYKEIKQLKNAIETERDYLLEEIKLEHNFDNIIGNSKPLKYSLFKVEQVAPTDQTVLIMGETGTGKELFARAIHDRSLRKNKVLIKVNCSTLPSNLIESELFGHEKGAFTGAQEKRIGRFELADGGTLFLDEIGELPLELQAKLLRVLQEGEFERLGSSRTIKVDVRIIAATNRELEKEAQKGRFRKDLWYRLNVFPITIPPLKDRQEDIPMLAKWFVKIYSQQMGKKIDSIPVRMSDMLVNYLWPGNVRELQNVISRAVVCSKNSTLKLADKLESLQYTEMGELADKSLEQIEHDYITRVLEKTHWKIEGVGGAASILELNPSTLRSRMRKLGIKKG